MRSWTARWGRAHPWPWSRATGGTASTVALPRGAAEQLRGLLLAATLALVLTLVLLAARGRLTTANVALLYLIPVLVGSTFGGLLPATLVAVAGVLALDLLFVVPYGVLNVASAQDGLTLLLFLGVAVLTSELAARARARADEATRRARATALLYDLSGALAAPDLSTILGGLAERLGRIFGLQSCTILLAEGDGALEPRGQWGADLVVPSPAQERGVAEAMSWALEHGTRVSLTLDRPAAAAAAGHQRRAGSAQGDAQAPSTALVLPLRGAGHAVGLLRLVYAPGAGLAEEDWQLLETFSTQAALAIERARLAEESAQAAVLRESDRVKSALLSSVSHELRTPLATIRGAGDALRQPVVAADPAVREELLGTIVEEAERLSELVGNLLDLSRIEAGALRPQRHLYDLAEISSRVAARLAPRLSAHRFILDLPAEGPLVPVDYQQIDGVLANLLDNAAKYAPPGSTVRLQLAYTPQMAVLAVEDEGPGIAPAERDLVFAKFYRVPGQETRSTPGTGLGLAICKGIVEAHGGAIAAVSSPSGGARIEVRLPLLAPPAAG